MKKILIGLGLGILGGAAALATAMIAGVVTINRCGGMTEFNADDFCSYGGSDDCGGWGPP